MVGYQYQYESSGGSVCKYESSDGGMYQYGSDNKWSDPPPGGAWDVIAPLQHLHDVNSSGKSSDVGRNDGSAEYEGGGASVRACPRLEGQKYGLCGSAICAVNNMLGHTDSATTASTCVDHDCFACNGRWGCGREGGRQVADDLVRR